MTRLRALSKLSAFCLLAFACRLQAQPQPGWEIESPSESGGVVYEFQTKMAVATNGVIVRYMGVIMTAERVSLNQATGDAIADGNVRVQREDQVWVGEHVRFNFNTLQMDTDKFRMGKPPHFAGGYGLSGQSANAAYDATNHPPGTRLKAGEFTNRVYYATNALITPDDFSEPFLKVRASRIKILGTERIIAYNAVLYIGEVPVFYWPYFSRSLKKEPNHLTLTPGYRSSFGAYVLGTYHWQLNTQLDGAIHLDYRANRGVGTGPDVNYHFGKLGEGTAKYYYTHDNDPDEDATLGGNPRDRQRVYFSYQAHLTTNFSVRSVVRYQSDPDVIRNFFEGDYRQNPQPNTYVEANKYSENFSLDAYVQPRVNDFLETVERLPDIRLTGYRQQLGASPIYYESETSAGYYQREFVETNHIVSTPAYSAGRADTYQQLLLPLTFFGWLNLTPRVGGRFTYYTETDGLGSTNEEQYRGVFNTGAELTFKASRTWPGIENRTFDLNGVRHIVQPSLNYVFVPDPSVAPSQLPQFDSELPSFRLLPIEYTDYNAIDSIDSQNVMRFGLKNKLQTKRNGQVTDFVSWDVYTDWRIKNRADQTSFSDLYSDFVIKPRSWMTLGSITRYDIYERQWRMSLTTLTLQPRDNWRWYISHLYLRDDLSGSPTALGYGNNVVSSDFMYRLNENWGFGMSHYFDALTGRLQEQRYSIYRDLRSWTAALSFQIRDNTSGAEDFTVAFTFSLKSFPHANRGYEAGGAYWLSGG